jgi:hypothetical protein
MTLAEALRSIRGYAAAGRIEYTLHAERRWQNAMSPTATFGERYREQPAARISGMEHGGPLVRVWTVKT